MNGTWSIERKKFIRNADKQQKEKKIENPNKVIQNLYPEIS